MHENHNGGSLDCVITHASLIRAVLDYVLIALDGNGEVIVGDAPLQSADFNRICAAGLNDIMAFYGQHANVPIKLVDFRIEQAQVDRHRLVVRVKETAGDPYGYAAVDFATRSMLAPIAGSFERYRVSDYDPERMREHHNLSKHEYLISRSILTADVVISIPKMKTHRKAGVTGALKNCVGINGHKDWLPHHTRGSARLGGDEYAKPSALKSAACALIETKDITKSHTAKRILRLGSSVLQLAGSTLSQDRYFEGSWWGNDTLWRTVLDLNRALLYADQGGILQQQPQRRTFFLMDGIIAGDHEGPVEPDPKPVGLLLGGTSAVVVDAVMARLMGFDLQKIPSVREAFRIPVLPLTDASPKEIVIVSNIADISRISLEIPGMHFGFVPASGWQGHIELKEASCVA
jgi:uncharacterized protein (DUF362 family)